MAAREDVSLFRTSNQSSVPTRTVVLRQNLSDDRSLTPSPAVPAPIAAYSAELDQVHSDETHHLRNENPEIKCAETLANKLMEHFPLDHEERFVDEPVQFESGIESSVELHSNTVPDVEEVSQGENAHSTNSTHDESTARSVIQSTSQPLSPAIPNWRVLWALLSTNGSRKYRKEQYQA